MFLDLKQIELSFTDFCILALLLAMLYSVSIFEAWLTRRGQEAKGLARENRRTAASIAFFGIFLTLLAGIGAVADRSGDDYIYLVVPLLFIGHWAWFHYQSSDMLDAQVLEDLLTRSYKDAVMQVIATHVEPLSVEEVRRLALDSAVYLNLLDKGLLVVKSATPLPVHELAKRLVPDVVRTRVVLDALVAEARVSRTDDERYAIADSAARASPRSGAGFSL